MSPPRLRRGIWTAALTGAVLWEFLGRHPGIRAGSLPTPSRIVLEMYREWPRLSEHALTTTYEVLAGMAWAAAAAVALAAALRAWTKISGTVFAAVSRVPAAPLIAFAPLLWILFGAGMRAKVALAALMAFFPLLVAALRGCAAAPEDLIDLARMAGAKPGRVLRTIRLPYAVPEFIRGLKSAAPFAMSGALAAELVVTDKGLGYLLLTAGSRMELPLLCAGLVVILGLGAVFHGGIILAERVLLRKQ